MRSVAAIVSLALHGGLLVVMSMLPERKSVAATHSLVEMKVAPPKPPPPPPVVEEKKVEEVIPPPEVKPKLVKKPTVVKSIPDEAKPVEPPKEKPKMPPQGFSVDMSSTVQGGGGVAVPAIDGGGNMFANPNDQAQPPGQKTSTPQPQVGGQGKGTAPTGSYQVTKMPEFIGSEAERTPPYPEDAREREIEGQVLLKVYVNTEGRVAQVKIVRKLDPSCDEIAVKWAKERFRFKPAMLGEEAVGMWIDVPVTFVIDR